MDQLRIAVVGIGVQGKLHAKTLLTRTDIDFVGVVDPVEANRKWAEEELGVRAFTAMDEVLDQVDAVTICMPDHLHEDITIAALAAGKRVLLEKPMAISTESCDRILISIYFFYIPIPHATVNIPSRYIRIGRGVNNLLG